MKGSVPTINRPLASFRDWPKLKQVHFDLMEECHFSRKVRFLGIYPTLFGLFNQLHSCSTSDVALCTEIY